jgi:acyl carrier protein
MPARPERSDPAVIIAELRAFITQRYLPRRQRPLGDDEPLLTSGIVDSLGLVDLAGFIEEHFDVLVTPDRFGAGRADTVREIAALIQRGG